MGFFRGREDKKEEKREEKLEKAMEYYNLNDLNEEDKEYVNGITSELFGSGLKRFRGNPEDFANLALLESIIEQNFLIIKLLNEMNQKMDKDK